MISQQQLYRSSHGDFEDGLHRNRWQFAPNQEQYNPNLSFKTSNYHKNQAKFHREHLDTLGSGDSNRRYNTDFSQTSNADYGFRRMKYNQMQALKELKQQYEILRDVPIKEVHPKIKTSKKHTSSEYSSQRDISDRISSSKQSISSKKQHQQHQDTSYRQVQLLSLEKKQLEVVIGNSMKKIEDLLNSQAEYKKIIRELERKIENKNYNDEYQNTIRNLKNKERETKESVVLMKSEIQKLKLLIKGAEEKAEKLDLQIRHKNYEIKSLQEEKHNFDDSLRLERDKRSNIQIDLRKEKMEKQLLEKEKNSEINRLEKLLHSRDPEKQRENMYFIKRLQEQIKIKEKRYDYLLNQFQNFKKEVNEKPPKQIIIKEQGSIQEQFKIFQRLALHMKEQSEHQTRRSNDILNTLLSKIESKGRRSDSESNKEEDRALLTQLFNLRKELIQLKENKKQEPIILTHHTNQEFYQAKITDLQNDIQELKNNESSRMAEYLLLESKYTSLKQEYDFLSQKYLSLNEKNKKLQDQVANSSEELRVRFRQKQFENEQNVRNLKYQLDQAVFSFERLKKEGDLNMNLKVGEYEDVNERLRTQLMKNKSEKEELREEIEKIKNYYEGKIKQKNLLIDRISDQELILKQEYEGSIKALKVQNEQELRRLVQKLEGMGLLNENYLHLSNKYSENQRQLHQLRTIVRKLKCINQSVDHLWKIKEAEYENIHQTLKQMNNS